MDPGRGFFNGRDCVQVGGAEGFISGLSGSVCLRHITDGQVLHADLDVLQNRPIPVNI